MDLSQKIAAKFPDYAQFINSSSSYANSTWNSDFSNGKALEFISQISLLSKFKEIGAEIKVDPNYSINDGLFYIRNEIPYHHGAQAGHDAAFQKEFSLSQLFLSSIIPKATIYIDGIPYMLYREGNPLHLLETIVKGGALYKERPDIVIVAGEIEICEVTQNNLRFIHKNNTSSVEIVLTIKNSGLIPLADYRPTENYKVLTHGVVECSVSKSKTKVDQQLDSYKDLFSSDQIVPECLFIHCKKTSSKYPTINLSAETIVDDIVNPQTSERLSKFIFDIITNN